MENLVTKFVKVIRRPDGSEVKLVAQAYFGAGLHRSVGVDVFRRERPDLNWKLCSDRPHPDWRKMSVAEYCKSGRSEKLQAASHGEIFAAAQMIGRPISMLPPGTVLQ